MKLTEILHTIDNERKSNLINIDDWKWNDVDHLLTMEFECDGNYHLRLKSPSMSICKQKTPEGKVYILEDEKKGKFTFKNFDGILNFFSHYDQPELNPDKDGDDD